MKKKYTNIHPFQGGLKKLNDKRNTATKEKHEK